MAIKSGNILQCKVGTLARTDTANKALFALPANAMVIGVRAFGPNSDSATSATLTLQAVPTAGGTAATFATVDAKATAASKNDPASMAGIAYDRQSTPVYVFGAYSEVGAAATGGAWTVVVEYL